MIDKIDGFFIREIKSLAGNWKCKIKSGYPFRLTGANEPIIEKHILKCQKI
jgi:hypothetical protein